MQDLSVSKSLKVLFLCEWYPNRNDAYNGLFIHNHAKAVADYCKVTVIYVGIDKTLISKNYDIDDKTENNLRIIRIYYKNTYTGVDLLDKAIKAYRYFNALYKGLKIYQKAYARPHIIHVNIVGRAAAIAFILKKLKKIPYIVTEHWTGYLPQSGKFRGLFKRYFTKLIINNANTVTTVSNNLRKCMLAHNLNGNYEIVPNVVNTDINVPKKYSQKIIALNISDLVDEMKNISGLINVVAAVVSSRPEFELHILGQGPDREKLEKFASELNLLNKNVFFFNYVPHEKVCEIIASSSFLIVNSRYETFSVVATEALACGIPVLTTRCGGPEEFINEENGMVIPPDNPEELVKGILWMSENYQTFSEEKLKSFVQLNFSRQVVAAKFLNLYKKHATRWKVGNSETTLNFKSEWKVLDVGSGNRPNERANVLLEKELEETEHRSGAKAVVPDWKKIVLGDALNMPFDEKEFDFVIASHVAEHIEDPELFCKELSRVGNRGYIETPGVLSEFFFNEPFHKWIVYKKKGTLIFKEKKNFKVFNEYIYRLFYLNSERYGHRPKRSDSMLLNKFVNFFRRNWKYLPYSFTRFSWESSIRCKVIRIND